MPLGHGQDRCTLQYCDSGPVTMPVAMVELYADLERALYVKRSEPKKRLRPIVAGDQDVQRFTVMSATSLGHVAEASRLIDRGCTAIYQVKQPYVVLDCKSAVRRKAALTRALRGNAGGSWPAVLAATASSKSL